MVSVGESQSWLFILNQLTSLFCSFLLLPHKEIEKAPQERACYVRLANTKRNISQHRKHEVLRSDVEQESDVGHNEEIIMLSPCFPASWSLDHEPAAMQPLRIHASVSDTNKNNSLTSFTSFHVEKLQYAVYLPSIFMYLEASVKDSLA